MFKTKEELKKEQHNLGLNMFDCGIEKAFNSFAERVEFYKKYHNDVEQFMRDFSGLIKEKYYNELWLNHHNYHSDYEHWNGFNSWLFDYCFQDVCIDE